MKTVLVTCVGSGVGQSVIDSLNLKRDFRIIGCDGNPNVYAHSYCDEFFVVPGLYTDGYLDHILGLAIENKVDIVVPGHDHELVLFAEVQDRFKEKGIEVVVSESKIIAISRDKKDWYNFFAPLGCKIVPTLSVNEFLENPDESILPAIVKPSGGSASQGISIINELKELEGLEGEDIIQPYLFPEKSDKNYQSIYNAVKNGRFLQMSEISIQLIFNRETKFSGMFISKNTLKGGVPVYVDPINPREFEYIDEIMKFVPILEEHGVRGPVNIQGRVTPNGLYFFEMNMRFTGITGNRAQLGFNEVDFLVRNFLGLGANIGEYAYNKVGVRQVACTTITRQYERKGKETVTVLGGGSNLGQIFIRQAIQHFQKINVVVRSESWEKYQDCFGDLTTVELIRDNDVLLEQRLCQSDVLINFVSALAYEEDVKKFEAIRYIQKMLVRISKANINKIINISSQSVYSQTSNIMKTEKDEIRYTGSYAFQKVLMEDMFASIKEFRPLSKVISLRLARVIAPSILNQAGFFGKMIKDYISGGTIEITNPANNTNLIHANDVVSAIRFILTEMDSKELPEVLNVGGDNVSMAQYVSYVQDLIAGTGKFNLGESEEVTNSSMVDLRGIEELGWSYEYKTTDIINELV